MPPRSYRTFKQLLKLAKTRRLAQNRSAGKRRQRAQTRRRTRRNPFRGGAATPLSADTTVVARIPGDDPESPPVVQSAAAFETAVEKEKGE